MPHTPGEWKAWKPVTHIEGEEVTWSVSGPPSDFMFLRNEADARLIAAAPELLAVLENMVAWFADPGRALYDAKPEVYLAGSKPIVSAARNAIADAERAGEGEAAR